MRQDFLGGLSAADSGSDGEEGRIGDYAELQVGPAFTQMQVFDMPRNATMEWTEFFGAFDGNAEALHSEDYTAATGEVEAWLEGNDGVSDDVFVDEDAWLQSIADLDPLASHVSSSGNGSGPILAYGSPWGAVEEIRRDAQASQFAGWAVSEQKLARFFAEGDTPLAVGGKKRDRGRGVSAVVLAIAETRALPATLKGAGSVTEDLFGKPSVALPDYAPGKIKYAKRRVEKRASPSGTKGTASTRLAPGLYFDHDRAKEDPEAQPWIELATTGEFSGKSVKKKKSSSSLLCADEKIERYKTWVSVMSLFLFLVDLLCSSPDLYVRICLRPNE